MVEPVVIVGTGLAGYNLAREFRKLDTNTPLTLVTADDGAFYSKPMLSNALLKKKTPAELIMQDSARMAHELNATILTQRRVLSISPADNSLQLDQQQTLTYSQCVLAVGAQPIRLALQGNALAQVYQVNDRQDYARFRTAISDKKRVAILGPGLIGCEFANDLISAGYQVDVIGPSEYPLDRLVPKEVGQAVQQALAQLGVNWHLPCTATAVNHHAEGLQLTLSNGTTLLTDVVLSAVGVQPNIELAKQAGIATRRGINVDQFLRTNISNIYAIGDCAEVEGQVLPYVLPLMQCVRALAKTLSGTATAVSYPPMPVQTKTPACLVVAIPPAADAVGQWRCEVTPDGIIAQCIRDGKLIGFALTGKTAEQKHLYTKQLPNVLN